MPPFVEQTHRSRKRYLTRLENDLIRRLDRASSRLLFLSRVSRILSSALTDVDCFNRLLELIVSTIADWATLNILTEDNRVQRVDFMHAQPKRQKDLAELVEHFQSSLSDPAGPGMSIRTGKAEFYPRLDRNLLLHTLKNPKIVERLEKFGIQSAIVVPLKAHQKILGAIFIVTSEPNHFLNWTDFKLAQDISERAAYAVFHLIRYKRAKERIEKMKIEIDLHERFLANTRHDIISALTAASLSTQMIRRVCGDGDLIKRTLESLEKITAAVKESGPIIPDQEQPRSRHLLLLKPPEL